MGNVNELGKAYEPLPEDRTYYLPHCTTFSFSVEFGQTMSIQLPEPPAHIDPVRTPSGKMYHVDKEKYNKWRDELQDHAIERYSDELQKDFDGTISKLESFVKQKLGSEADISFIPNLFAMVTKEQIEKLTDLTWALDLSTLPKNELFLISVIAVKSTDYMEECSKVYDKEVSEKLIASVKEQIDKQSNSSNPEQLFTSVPVIVPWDFSLLPPDYLDDTQRFTAQIKWLQFLKNHHSEELKDILDHARSNAMFTIYVMKYHPETLPKFQKPIECIEPFP